MSEESFVTMNGQRKLFHAPMNTKIDTAARIGCDSGMTIDRKTRMRLAPSIRAASSSSMGIWSKNFLRMNTIAGAITCGRMMPQYVSTMFRASIW